MAVERGLAGFENGDTRELTVSTGAGTSSLNTLAGAKRSGTYGLRVAPATSQQRFAALPAGSIIGTSGTVTSGNKKRLRVRTFLRINTFPNGSSPNENRVFGSGSFGGTAVMWVRASDNHFGLNLFGGAVTYNASALTTGVWYQVTLDILLDVSASTQITATLTVANEDGTGARTTTLGPTALGSSTDTLNVITFGDSGGDHASAYSVDFDDVVWTAASNADAVNALTLPTQTAIVPVLVTGSTLNQWETGSVSNIDEIPIDTSGGLGDTLSSVHTSGTEVDLTYQSTDTLAIGFIVGAKVFALMQVGSASVGNVDVTFHGVTRTIALNNGGYSSGPSMIGYQDWSLAAGGLIDEDTFNAGTINIVKQNGTQQTYIGAVSMEVLYDGVPTVPTVTSALSPNSGPTSGGTSVTILGTGFTSSTPVYFDGFAARITSVRHTRIVCVTPPHAAALVDVMVGKLGSSVTVDDAFTFIGAQPTRFTLESARREPEVHIQSQLGTGPSTFGFSINGEDATDFQAGASLDIEFESERLARGILLTTELTVEDSRFNERVDANGSDNTWVLNSKLVVGTWVNVSATVVLQEILSKFAPEFSSVYVEGGLPNISIAFFRDVTVGGALDRIVKLIPAGHWYLDDNNAVHLHSGNESTTNPSDITDADQNLLLNPPIKIKTDVSQCRNRVYVRGAGLATSTGYQAPVPEPQVNQDNIVETGGNIDSNRNSAPYNWTNCYAAVWVTANGDSLAGFSAVRPSPFPLLHSYFITGSVLLRFVNFGGKTGDERITGLKIYRQLQRDGPHGINASTYGNTDLFTPNADYSLGGNFDGPFFAVTTIPRSSFNSNDSEIEYTDVASEDTLVGGEMKKTSELIGQDHTANIFAMVQDSAAQATLKALLGFGDGVREFLINDPSITTVAEAEARAQAELDLFADPIVTVIYGTRDPLTKAGKTIHFNITHPALSGDFKIQNIDIQEIHVDNTLEPVIVATASSLRFTIDDLLQRVVLSDQGGQSGGSGTSFASQAAAGSSGAAVRADRLSTARTINGTSFDGTANINITAAPDHLGETPTGAVNGVNTVYTTAAIYKTGSLTVYVNGVRQKKTTHWTETTGTTFTMNQAPLTSDLVTVDYETN